MINASSLRASGALFSALLLSASGVAYAQSVPIVQPGAPGQASKKLTAEEATKLAQSRYTASDVAFMQHMIVHHQQALDMAMNLFSGGYLSLEQRAHAALERRGRCFMRRRRSRTATSSN